MIPTKYLIPLVVLLVVIAYMYIGEAAIAGLLAMLLGKSSKKDIENIEDERDEHERLEGEKLDLAVQNNIEADQHHIDAQDTADAITQPREPVKSGATRKRFTFD